MPTYEYVCRDCNEHLEVVQSFRDDPLATCGKCGGSLRKVFTPAGIIFKGSGFYSTDNRTSQPTGSSASSGGSGDSSGSSDSDSAGSESSGSSDSASGSSDSGSGASESGSGSSKSGAGSKKSGSSEGNTGTASGSSAKPA